MGQSFFEKARTMINPKKMHHFMSYSELTNDRSSTVLGYIDGGNRTKSNVGVYQKDYQQ